MQNEENKIIIHNYPGIESELRRIRKELEYIAFLIAVFVVYVLLIGFK